MTELGSSRPSRDPGRTCVAWRTGCSARSRTPRMRCKRPGSGLDRSEAERIDDLRSWLTTVVGRICLDMLRRRKMREHESIDAWLPEPIVSDVDESDPEAIALVADSVGLALLVVMEQLSPAERVAFVLHDVFA